MSVTLSLFAGAGAQFFDSSGNPLTGGKIYTYLAGTTTPYQTYTTNSDSPATQHTNPIILDSAGRVNEIWLVTGIGYKFVLKDANDVPIATYDNIPSSAQPAAANDADSIMYEQGYLVNAGSFVAGKMYRIVSVGTTNFTLIGATSNTVGLHFIATGPGSGDGTAELSTTVEDKLREYVSVKDFGAVGDGVVDDTTAIQNAINFALANKKSVYVPAGVYLYTASNFSINTQLAQTNLLIFGDGAGGGYATTGSSVIKIDADGTIFKVTSISFLPFTCRDMTFEVANPLVNTNVTIFYFTTSFGSCWQFENVDFLYFTNCAIHGIRSYNAGAKRCNFQGTSLYNESSGLLPLDDACVRLWGADGTLTVQDHSFSNLCTFERCVFSNARYGIDGWGLCGSTFISCTFTYTWIGFLNRPAPTVAGGNISSTDKSGYNKAFAHLTACWYEDNAKYHYSNVDVDPATGNDLNPSYVSKISLFQNADEYTFGVNRYQDFLQSSSYRTFVDANGSVLPSNYTWFNAFTNDESGFDVTYYDFKKGSAYIEPALTVNDVINSNTISVFNTSAGEVARFMGNAAANLANGFRVECTGATNRHTRLISSQTQTLVAYETSTGVKAGDAPLALDFVSTRPGVDNSSDLGTGSFRWKEVFAVAPAINTSDAREKQDIEELNEAEKRVAIALKGLVKKYRFKDAVAKKGNDARIHVGVVVQEVIAAFEAEGLNPMRYAMVCYNEWDAELDENGNEIAPAGNRYGIRYGELMAFIISAL